VNANTQPKVYTFYAGDLRLAELPQIGDAARFNLDTVLPTAVEYGGVNVLAADRVKQPQKALYGQLVVQPRDAVARDLQGNVTDHGTTADITARPGSPAGSDILGHRGASGHDGADLPRLQPGVGEDAQPPLRLRQRGAKRVRGRPRHAGKSAAHDARERELRHRAHLLPVRHPAAVGCR